MLARRNVLNSQALARSSKGNTGKKRKRIGVKMYRYTKCDGKVMRLTFEVKTSLGALCKNHVGIELD